MSDSLSRRDALKKLAMLSVAAALADGAGEAAAADPPHLSATDPTAVALSYHEDATKVDPQQFQTYHTGQRCGTCLQLQGQDGQPWRPCTLFPGELVNANGWCRVWVQKS
jgi:hypothetical protein